jgi:uncharacterized protein (TIGR00730 family)
MKILLSFVTLLCAGCARDHRDYRQVKNQPHTLSVGVFASSKMDLDPQIFAESKKLMTLLAQKKGRIVYGGGKIGLMGYAAQVMADHQRPVIAVVPDLFAHYPSVEGAYVERMKTLSQRKEIFEKASEAFVALPGGVGTLDEIASVMAQIQLKQLCFDKKRMVLLNVNGFWDPFMVMLKSFVKNGTMPKDNLNLVSLASTAEEAIALLYAPAPSLVSKD